LRKALLGSLVCTALVVPSAVSPASAGTDPAPGSRFQPGVSGARGAVSTEDPLATATALRVLGAGGNAFDAAAAAVFTIGVTKPEACGIGGGGFLIARPAGGKVVALDFREKAPSSPSYTPRWRMDVGGAGLVTGEEMGRGVVGVPGTVDGMRLLFERLGSKRVTWKDLIADASRHARDGFDAQPDTTNAVMARLPSLAVFPESFRLLALPALAGSATGTTRLQLTEYADTLDRIAAKGGREFYEGETARLLAAEMARTSGLESSGDVSEMTLSDLQRYRAVWRTPVRTTYRGFRVYGVPAPTSGPTAVIETLNILEAYDLAAAGRGSANTLHLVAEAKKLAWADRNAYLGDPDQVRVPTKTLTSKRYADRRRALLDPQRASSPRHGATEVRPGTPVAGREGPRTTSLSVIDERGNAIAVTCTLEHYFGSAFVPSGLGFPLNGQLHDFDEVPKGSSANAPAPGKRPRSSTSPMLLVKDGVPVLAVGGQGGPTIPGGVLWAILGVVDFGLDGARALDAPRVDAFTGTALDVEDTRFVPQVLADLRARGHQLTLQGEYATLPVLTAVGTRGALRWAAGDPRGQRWPATQR